MLQRLQNILRMIRDVGLVPTVLLAVHRQASARWERRLGVETMGDHRLETEGLAHPDRHDHSPSSVLDLRRALRLASPNPRHDVFLDLGAGKGRALLLAATLPFRRVIGVELSPQLVSTARANVERARPRLACGEVDLIQASADEYEIPPDVSVIYFYNPFTGAVLDRVLANLRRSLAAAPRSLRVVFATPPHFERAIVGESWVVPRAQFTGLRRHVIYECTAPPNSASAREGPHSSSSSVVERSL